ncbi:hypothetical protein [Nonomuraea dietziae]|uniref:hypothetical protein n=1 Tax=Nonomuraea dietziae TaxID=65515 RepID=UPI0031CE0EE1
MDGAGVDKDAAARHLGFPAPFGQSPFAITRGNAFEALVKARRLRGAAEAAARRAAPADRRGGLPGRAERRRPPAARPHPHPVRQGGEGRAGARSTTIRCSA